MIIEAGKPCGEEKFLFNVPYPDIQIIDFVGSVRSFVAVSVRSAFGAGMNDLWKVAPYER
jgi:hypothetical protein